MMGVSDAKDSAPKSAWVISASRPHTSFHVAKGAPASTRHAGSMLRLQDHQIRSGGVRPARSALFSAAETRVPAFCPFNRRDCISDARTSNRFCTDEWNGFTLVDSSQRGPASFDIIAQANDRLGFDLRDARHVHIQDGSDFPNVLTLPVIQVQDNAFGTG